MLTESAVSLERVENLYVSNVLLTANRSCSREGCLRRKKIDGYCSKLCLEIDRKLSRIRDAITRDGINPTAAELWAAAVSLSDQLSEVHRLEALLNSLRRPA